MLTTVRVHEGRVDASPEKLGFNPQRLELLDQHFGELIEAGKLQGASYLVARDGQIVTHRSLGKLTNHEDSTELLPSSIRRVYSITKVITAVAIAQLMDEGKLYIHQPVSTIIKEFDTDMHRNITIWHLLTHTSGLMGDPGCHVEPYGLPWHEWWSAEKKKKADSWETGDWVRTILSGRMYANLGEKWNYCTAGFSVLSEIIARVSGLSYEDFIRERIAEPLGMERSFFIPPDELKHEVCYTSDWEKNSIFDPMDRTGMPAQGGSGYYSTLEDLFKFGQMVLNGGTFEGKHLLSRKTVALMVSNQLHNVTNVNWGNQVDDQKHALGWSLNSDDICTPGTYSHEGYGHSGLYVDPKERLVFVFFVPNKEGWVPAAVINPRAIVWSALL